MCGFGEGVVGSDRHGRGQPLRTPSAGCRAVVGEHQNSAITARTTQYAYFQPSCSKRYDLCMDHNATKLLLCREQITNCFPCVRQHGGDDGARAHATQHEPETVRGTKTEYRTPLPKELCH